ncbi:glutamine-hydrolyzing carbamoyl-phosphate synthase small subunit [Formicincola oecophyllae]|uniref:Carbamoyl phosphate synthase small chain n=1 Tax=Formicincola oecophyllae TaxID=2558361 RepID=A0A4Y6U6W2_9PROT|nr:glutamine-hydrolyzing carbamoyl-phosphate synthase small subunit [Formicincola oecophyllae]QDH13112.1 glutamine-hydrolyzing carbamoyl-phosphate synthase small subunit [Formicincola oecophyllae]
MEPENPPMQDVDSIITAAGGAAHVARLAGVGSEAVRKWRQSGAIPAKHWPLFLSFPGVNMAMLTALAPRQKSTTLRPKPLQAQRAATPPAPSTHHGKDRMTQRTTPNHLRANLHQPAGATAALILADGTVLWGRGFGAYTPAEGGQVAELCFCTAMSGYQETLTDPSFTGQIITFTFPHIGNTGTNAEDHEASHMLAAGMVVKDMVTEPSSWRNEGGAEGDLRAWLTRQGKPGIAGLDTRFITRLLRDHGPQSAVIAYPAEGQVDVKSALERVRLWEGLEGADLGSQAARPARSWDKGRWEGFIMPKAPTGTPRRVVALDFGAKDNILRSLVSAGCAVQVLPGTASFEDIMAQAPEGVFLSNGPGDPAATGVKVVPVLKKLLESAIPLFGICLGHQLLAHALGGKTTKMARGHHGANQPVKDLATGRVEITSQNHGFAVDEASLPADVVVTHRSLFDGTNEGIASPRHKAFSVQYHPEASPGPTDSQHLFQRFVANIDAARAARANTQTSPNT